MASICVFCGSSPGTNPAFLDAAQQIGQALARQEIELVYGGGGRGMMGAVADSTLAAGGRALGVIPEGLFKREGLHTKLTRLEIVNSMHERKALMAASADAFLALPGGIGTLEELFEIWTWTQIGIHAKPCGILNTAGYYDPLLTFLDSMVANGFVAQAHRDVVLVDDDPTRLVERVLAHHPQVHERWLTAEQT
jgi:uncharacterized protein (TIGR00730 family)